MVTTNGTVRSLKFSKAGNHLVTGNDYGEIVIFDIVKGIPIEIIQTCQIKAVWSMDISWDDQMLAVGTEEGTIELYNFQKISQQTGKVPQNPDGISVPRGTSYLKASSPSFIKLFKTKSNGILLTKFSWRNFLYTIGNYN
jgi:WD40 repeat protein